MNELEIGNAKMPSVITDPFKKGRVTGIHVHASKSIIGGGWSFSGTVKFENGQTAGEQKFNGDSFDDAVLKIKAMIDNLE
jgi:hypothetical protein